MRKLRNAFLIQIILLLGTFIFLYTNTKNANIQATLSELIDLFIPIAGVSIFISLTSILDSKYIATSVTYIIFIILTIGIEFSIREFLIPSLEKENSSAYAAPINAPKNILSQEFADMHNLPLKKGIVVQNATQSFSLGVTAKQNQTSYLVKNIFISKTNQHAVYAQQAKILSNTLVLYDAVVFTETNGVYQKTEELKAHHFIPLPFNINTIFDLWNIKDPKKIRLLSVLFNVQFLKNLQIPIWLALSHYIAGFLILLIMSMLGITYQNRLGFQGFQSFGTAAAYFCIYPGVILLYYYLTLTAQIIIYLIENGG